MKTLAFFVTLMSGGLAVAEPRFEIVDRGTAVEVIAYEVKAASTAVNPARSRLEVDLVGFPKINALTPTDANVKVIELDGASPRRLSVKLGYERPQVKSLSKFAQAIQVGEDLHLMFPREVPAEGARVVLPEPTLPKDLAAKLGPQPVAQIGPQPPKPEPVVAAKPEAPKADPIPTKPDDKKADAKPDAAAGFLAPAEPSSNFSMYMMAGLGAIALGLLMYKKKKGAVVAAPATIDVVAQRSLGAKAKVVWLNAGGREMVVAVTPQQVRMLGQWKKELGSHAAGTPRFVEPANMPFAQALESQRSADRLPRAGTASPIAGILKLRERASTYEGVNDDVATGDLDADALWAKEIFAAAGGRK